jgi:hypothetical protein
MKRILAIVIASLLCLASLFSLSVFAEEEAKVNVKVSVTTKNSIKAGLVDVAAGDEDGDGAITISDALYVAHKIYCSAGVSGYAAEESEFGLSLVKLWGDDSGNFGYYLNHKPATSLADTIKEGDVINACIYEGVYPNMESYAYFDKDSAVVSEGGSVTLTLMKLGYDENFNTVSSPVANAKLTVDAAPWGEYTTDENGKVTFTPEWTAEMIVSALGENEEIIMPVCRVWVDDLPEDSDTSIPEGTVIPGTNGSTATDKDGNTVATDKDGNVATDKDGKPVVNNGSNSQNGAAGGCGGCSSTFGGISIVIVSIVGASALVIRRKERD